jgi:hypothetical protein
VLGRQFKAERADIPALRNRLTNPTSSRLNGTSSNAKWTMMPKLPPTAASILDQLPERLRSIAPHPRVCYGVNSSHQR